MRITDLLIKHNGEDVSLTIIYLVGAPGTGKTTLSNALISRIVEIVGRENIWYVKTRNVKDVFGHINPDKEYNIFFVDDAMREQSGRRSMSKENIDIYINLPDIRHIAKKRGMKRGKIIIFIASQIPKGVDLIIRSFAKLTIFKSMNLFEEEHQRILRARKIPEWEIQDWLNGVVNEEPWALSRGLVILPSGAWGWLTFEKVEEIKPDVDHYYIDVPAQEQKEEEREERAKEMKNIQDVIKQELEKMKKSRKWKLKASILERTLSGETNLSLADKFKIPEATIRYYKNQAMGELRRRVGLIYEGMVAERLKQMGYENVERHGGEGEPDITCEKDGVKIAVSVKLYDYGRARHSLNKVEFKPELKYAKEHNGKAYLYYTNLAWNETYFFEIPEHGDLVTLKRGKGLIL